MWQQQDQASTTTAAAVVAEVAEDAEAAPHLLELIRSDAEANCSLPPLPLFWRGATAQEATMDALYLCKVALALLALAGSSVSAAVFRAQRRRNALMQMLLHLSACEVVLSLSAFVFELFYLLVMPTTRHSMPAGPVWLAYSVLCGFWPVYKASMAVRNWLIVHIAWRRYRAVGDAIGSRRQGDSRRAINLTSAGLWIAAGLVTLPRAFEVVYTRCPASGQIVDLNAAPFANSSAYRAYPSCYFALQSLAPVCCLLLTSCLTLCRLRRSHREFLHDLPAPIMAVQRRRVQNEAVNRTVLVLCSVFVVCELPMLLAGVMKDFDCRDACQVFLGLANILNSADSVANFLIYFLSIRQFKRRLLCCSAAANASKKPNGGDAVKTHRRDINSQWRKQPDSPREIY